jgi:hypothetical protein
MEISPARLQAFKELYKEEFDIELTDSETYEKACLVLSLIKMSITPKEVTAAKTE